jgi:hypothetical protein
MLAEDRLGTLAKKESCSGACSEKKEVENLAYAVHGLGHWSAHATVGFRGKRCKAAPARPQPQPKSDCWKWKLAAVAIDSPNR